MEDADLRDAMLGSAADADGATKRAQTETGARADARRIREAVPPRDLDDVDAPAEDDVIGRPKKVGRRGRYAILGISFAFLVGLAAMTLVIMVLQGPDPLTFGVMAILVFVLYGLINAATYDGKDPLAPLREIDAENEAKDRERLERRERLRAQKQEQKQEQKREQRDRPEPE